MEKIVSLCKRRGFVYPGSEIYGGLANTYDYGPLGVELKNNIKQAWWKYFIQDREDMVGLDGGIILSPKIWEASGHVENFQDSLVECKKCHHRFRPDKLVKSGRCPDCGGELTEPKMFSGLFKTTIGPVEEEGTVAYLRPETAQAIFANYKNILNSTGRKIPFGIGQIGKAFRNEITTGNFIFRTLEFEQMEIEYFISPDADWKKIFNDWLTYIYGFADIIGLNRKKMFNNEISDAERAFYSKRTIDIEYKFPFGEETEELWAIAYRTDYDLSRHQEHSGESMEYFDEVAKKKYIPHVIEPTFGVDRTLLALIADGYTEEKSAKGESRIVLKLKPQMAPYKIAVAPLLSNKEKLVVQAKLIYEMLKKKYNCVWDDRGNIGKRYWSQDEIGTPYFITVDFETLDDKAVTIRDRDTTKQDRVKIGDLASYFSDKLGSPC
jgi:glycyl-tRNA synthetase